MSGVLLVLGGKRKEIHLSSKNDDWTMAIDKKSPLGILKKSLFCGYIRIFADVYGLFCGHEFFPRRWVDDEGNLSLRKE